MTEIDYKLEYIINEAAEENVGIHPAAYDGVPRSEYGNGWNDAMSELLDNKINIGKWFRKLDADIRDKMVWLITVNFLMINYFGGEDKKIMPLINANDTFYYSCADATEIDLSEINEYYDICKEHGYEGSLVWQSLKRNEMPLEKLQNDKFKTLYEQRKK